jgi:hypothetical protein
MNPIPRRHQSWSVPAVHVIRYNPVDRRRVQAFVDIQIDGVLRLNGIHLMRDGSVEARDLRPLIHHKRAFIPAIEILDPGLLESLTAAILAAIRAHLETLPPEQRVKPPRQSGPRPSTDRMPAASAKPLAVPIKAKPARTAVAKPPGREAETAAAGAAAGQFFEEECL